MSSGQHDESVSAVDGASARSDATPDPQLLEAILQETLREHGDEKLPPAVEEMIARHGGREPDESIVIELVDAALSDFWFGKIGPDQRRTVCEGVAQRLSDDPQAMVRIRRLLQSGVRGGVT